MKFVSIFCWLAMVLSTASAEPVVVIVRHAEKASVGGKDPDLSEAGRSRAEALARILKDAEITAIFTTEFKRTEETAEPLAKLLGAKPIVIAANDTATLISRLHQLDGNALVVGHGDTIPNIIKALGIATPVQISDQDYTEIFLMTLGDTPRLLRLHYP